MASQRWTGLLVATLAGVVTLVGAAGALAQDQRDRGHGNGSTMEPARHYIEWMIPHHEDAVAMADLAPTQAEHPEIRFLAATIIQTQTAEIARMHQWYQQWYGTDVLPNPMMGEAMPMTGMGAATQLDGARPFDKAFIEQMVAHHEMAVMGSTMALRMVDRLELRDLLNSIIESQSAEINQMRAWYQDWYGLALPATGMAGHATGGHQMAGMPGGAMGVAGSHGMGRNPNDHRMGSTRGHDQMMGGMGSHVIGDSASHATTTARQDMIHERGALVMPFDLRQTTHRFQVLPDGGLQTVTANDPTNQVQIALVQQHLAQEAGRFQRGDFSDPAALHGGDMPGLAELAATTALLEVVYQPAADGGQIRYASQDPATIDALHRWFAAQLADHGTDSIDR